MAFCLTVYFLFLEVYKGKISSENKYLHISGFCIVFGPLTFLYKYTPSYVLYNVYTPFY